MNAFRLFLALVAVPFMGTAQTPQDIPALPPDDPVLQRLDDLAHLPWVMNDPFTADTALLNVHGFPANAIPTYPATEMQRRLSVLDQQTPFVLTYNPVVQSYIDLYAVRKREQTSRMLGMAQLYFPVFEDALDRHGMPQELKYLAVVESALYPAARSRAAAVGLWQFIASTGKLYGLRVDSYVDERCDVYMSTDAACRYLKDLHRIFGNWELALAAYNCGPGNVNKAIRRSGGRMDYWEVYDHLPRETRGYVPAFIAVNYIFEHAADHNIFPVQPNYCAYEVDTVQVCYPLTLADLARYTGGNETALRDLNPVFKQGYVPDPDQPVTLYMPRELVRPFLAREDSLRYRYLAGTEMPATAAAPAPNGVVAQAAPPRISTHTVRRGESLGTIAQRNGITVAQLRSWNGLRGDRIQPGQKLRIERPTGTSTGTAAVQRPAPAPPVAQTEKPAPVAPNAEAYIYHIVQPGDTLWGIAQLYPGVTVEDLRRMNAGLNSKRLAPGEKIKVGMQPG
ncbi:MAG: LysM peptidoglycan-binding domain-containing protein [Flavobacteriales bacterium]|nr:LysM peptidoglycan-binding domain-containing protein [Flavobacteriales bacterium]